MTTRGGSVRPAAVAGAFYPHDRDDLADTVSRLLTSAPPPDPDGLDDPAALVAPHAGYIYSGSLAATAYRRLPRGPLQRIVVLGPAHFVPLHGMAVSSAAAFATPLGEVPVDTPACRELVGLRPDVVVDDLAHLREHAVEVQLPFLQLARTAGWALVPLLVGVTKAEAVADALDVLCVDPGSLAVVSTDLSHYLDLTAATERDHATVDAVLRLDDAAIGGDDACGRYALRGLLRWAARHGLTATKLGWSTSAEASGDRSCVVGYAACAVGRSTPA